MSKQPIPIPSFLFCLQCKFVLTSKTYKFYCCNKQEPVCPKCINVRCKVCMMIRNKHLNSPCSVCHNLFQEDFFFYDFKGNKNYCAKCLSQKYIYHYQQMLKDRSNPKIYKMKVSPESEYSFEEFINFYKIRCFCCIKKLDKNAFEMIHGARICCSCLEFNFDKTMSKLIMCTQCNGYIHDRSQIQIQTSLSDVLCIYCAKDSKKNENALLKKNEKEQSKIKTRSSFNNSKILISAVQISKIGQNKLSKIISRSSIQQESLDIPITIEIKDYSFFCIVCNCKFNEKSVFKLTEQEINKLQQAKFNAFPGICFVCFNSKQIRMPQKLERIFGINEKELKPQQLMKTAAIRSNKLISNPPIQKNKEKSQKVLQLSPRAKQILCCKCKKSKGTIQTSKGFYCLHCLD